LESFTLADITTAIYGLQYPLLQKITQRCTKICFFR